MTREPPPPPPGWLNWGERRFGVFHAKCDPSGQILELVPLPPLTCARPRPRTGWRLMVEFMWDALFHRPPK